MREDLHWESRLDAAELLRLWYVSNFKIVSLEMVTQQFNINVPHGLNPDKRYETIFWVKSPTTPPAKSRASSLVQSMYISYTIKYTN